jgi:hypothetical protein
MGRIQRWFSVLVIGCLAILTWLAGYLHGRGGQSEGESDFDAQLEQFEKLSLEFKETADKLNLDDVDLSDVLSFESDPNKSHGLFAKVKDLLNDIREKLFG